MPKSFSLKRSLAVFGLSLSAAFNIQAADAPTTGADVFPVVAATMSQVELDKKLIEAINDTGVYFNAKEAELKFLFNPLDSVGLQSRIDNIKAIIQAGANPNNYVPQALSFLGERDVTPLGAAILLGAASRRPDLVQLFLDKGADIRQRTAGGYGPMDFGIYAIREAQVKGDIIAPSIADFEVAVKILKLLNDAGLRPDDATMLTKGSKINTGNYAKATNRTEAARRSSVNGMVLRSLLYKYGLLSKQDFDNEVLGDRKNAEALLNSNGITDQMLEANGGKLSELNLDVFPGSSKLINVRKTSNLLTVAQLFKGIMGVTSDEEALRKIGELNKMTLTMETAARSLGKDQVIELPVSPLNQIGFVFAEVGQSLYDIASQQKNVYYKKGASVEEIATDIALINGIDSAKINDKSLLEKGRQLTIGYANDDYTHVTPMTPPAGADTNRKVDLLIIEDPQGVLSSESEEAEAEARKKESFNPVVPHGKDTYRVAVNTGYGINRKVDQDRFHVIEDSVPGYPNTTSNVLRILMNTAGAPINDRVILSVSEASFVPQDKHDAYKSYLSADNINYEGTRLMLTFLDKSKPIIFAAPGNWRQIEGPYIQSHIAIHSPRSVLVGAAGLYESPESKDKKVLTFAPYTSYSADICVKLAKHAGIQDWGTSFTTPLIATLDRQWNEWYGNRLSPEEIMAAGFMTADRDALDHDDPAAMDQRLNRAANQSGPSNLPHGENAPELKVHKPQYNSNGGGLPRNVFCGAGVVNPDKWKAALDLMLTLKRPGQDGIGKSLMLPAGTAVVQPVNVSGKQEYTYRLSVPENMTLGRLTFLLPQDRKNRGEVVVKTPAGFEMQMPRARSDVVSTQAFAYEDVKVGDVIEIRTNYPLGSNAGIILRGHAPGNAIAQLRDKLRADGTLPAPLMQLSGNAVTSASRPVTVLRDDKPSSPGIN